jgi:hypothetical protein
LRSAGTAVLRRWSWRQRACLKRWMADGHDSLWGGAWLQVEAGGTGRRRTWLVQRRASEEDGSVSSRIGSKWHSEEHRRTVRGRVEWARARWLMWGRGEGKRGFASEPRRAVDKDTRGGARGRQKSGHHTWPVAITHARGQ